jgi:hypothetical protein
LSKPSFDQAVVLVVEPEKFDNKQDLKVRDIAPWLLGAPMRVITMW